MNIFLLIAALILITPALIIIAMKRAGFLLITKKHLNLIRQRMKSEFEKKLAEQKGTHELEKTILFDQLTERDFDIIRMEEELAALKK
jgi:hypothetical protein